LPVSDSIFKDSKIQGRFWSIITRTYGAKGKELHGKGKELHGKGKELHGKGKELHGKGKELHGSD